MMPVRYLLERVFMRAEYDPKFRVKLHAVGKLLGAAIDGPCPDHELDRLVGEIDGGKRSPPLPLS